MLIVCILPQPSALPCCCVPGDEELGRKDRKDGRFSTVTHSLGASPPPWCHMCREHSPAHPLGKGRCWSWQKSRPKGSFPSYWSIFISILSLFLSPLMFLQRWNTTPPQPPFLRDLLWQPLSRMQLKAEFGSGSIFVPVPFQKYNLLN